MPKLVVYLNWTPIFECYVGWCGSKNGHQKDMCSKHIGLRAQSITITSGSIVNMIWGTNMTS